jgi:hypothetical protein
MIVNAIERFGCAHRLIATRDGIRSVFLCDRCGHCAELLPLHRDTRFGRVVAFSVSIIAAPGRYGPSDSDAVSVSQR